MQILNKDYSSPKQNNPNFKALYMNKKQIFKVLGSYNADRAEGARKALEELAKDVDIFVRPDRGDSIASNSLIVPLQDATRNPVERLLLNFRLHFEARDVVFTENCNIARNLVKQAADLKRDFLEFKKVENKFRSLKLISPQVSR